MSIKNDRWIKEQCIKPYGSLADWKPMIEPYSETQTGEGIISFGPSSFGYDIRAGLEWKIFTDMEAVIIDPKAFNPHAFHEVDATDLSHVIIPPNSYALTHSLEYIRMPHNVTGICVGKSTYARCGIHVNVTPLEAGWEGQITIEISNGTRLPVKVYPGEGIMQVLFFEGPPPITTYAQRKGKYQGQKGVTPARILPVSDKFGDSAKPRRGEGPLPG